MTDDVERRTWAQRYTLNACDFDDIFEEIDAWHDESPGVTLPAWLGLSEDEYGQFAMDRAIFEASMNARRGAAMAVRPVVHERVVQVDVKDILGLIVCAHQYGFERDVLFCSFTNMLGRQLGDAEIEAYADDFVTPEGRAQGYTEEDRDDALETLRGFRERYISGKGGEHE